MEPIELIAIKKDDYVAYISQNGKRLIPAKVDKIKDDKVELKIKDEIKEIKKEKVVRILTPREIAFLRYFKLIVD